MASLGIITRDRPRSLQKLLESLSRSESLDGLIVVDESGNSGIRLTDSNYVRIVADSLGIGFKFVTVAEKAQVVDCTISTLRDSVAFALKGGVGRELTITPGAGRNTLLLSVPTDVLCLMDDDTLYEYWAIKNRAFENDKDLFDETIEEVDPRYNSGPIGDQRAIKRLMVRTDFDSLNWFERTLGSSKDVDPYSPLIGFTGIVGSRWYSKPNAVLYCQGEVRLHSFSNRHRYEAAKRSDLALMCATISSVVKSPFFVTCSCGMTTTHMLPPFIPFGENEDSIFGLMYQAMYPTRGVVHTNHAVTHASENTNQSTNADFSGKSSLGTLNTVIVRDALKSISKMNEPKDTLRVIGNRIVELTEYSDREWIEYMRHLRRDYLVGIVQHLNSLLERYAYSPNYWSSDVSDYISALSSDSNSLESIVPDCLFGADRNIYDSIRKHKQLLASFGELILSWPAIWQSFHGSKDT